MALTVEQMFYGVWCDKHLICSRADSDQNATGQVWYGLTEVADFQVVRYRVVKHWSSKDSVWYKIRCCFYSSLRSDCVCTAVRWGWCHSSQLYSRVPSQRSTQSKGTTSNTLINSATSAFCLLSVSICTLWFNARYETVTIGWNILNNCAKFQTILKINFIKHI